MKLIMGDACVELDNRSSFAIPSKCVFIYNELWLRSNSLQNDGAIPSIYNKCNHTTF